MARNVVINGVTYNGVESITTPTIDGETAVFPDTSADSVKPEVLQKGYTAHNAAGEPIEGAAEMGAANVPKTATGENITLTDSAEAPLRGLTVYGKSTQDGTPTPDAPVPIVSVGDDGTVEVIIEGGADDTAQTLPISTPDGLCGIPIADGGNYTDANGQQWVCDEIDFVRGVRMQRIGKVDFGELTWQYLEITSATSDRKFCAVTHGLKNTILIRFTKPDIIAEKYTANAWSLATIGQMTINADGLMRIYTAERNQKPDGTAIYILAEPIETPLTAEELEAYRALRTNSPTTIIYADDDAGLSVDYDAEPYAAGVVDGKKAEWEAFCDVFQDFGNRWAYSYAFSNNSFDDEHISRLKYPIGSNTDLSAGYMFYDNRLITTIPLIRARSWTNWNYTFTGTKNLKSVRFENNIGKDIDFKDCPLLDKETVIHIIGTALSGTASGTITFNAAVKNNFSDDEWNQLIAMKPNWTVVLA